MAMFWLAVVAMKSCGFQGVGVIMGSVLCFIFERSPMEWRNIIT